MVSYHPFKPEECEFVSVAHVNDVQPGERLLVEIDDYSIVLFNLAGEFYAIADLCSHDYGPLGDGEMEGMEIICPRHGARFDVRSGKVLALPAVENIPVYPVRLIDGEIQIGVPLA